MIGRQLGQYRILDQIGKGGMGIVFLAEDTRLGRRIALKLLPAEMSADPGRRARFEREARAVAALNHPNIVTLHSVEEVEGHSFLTMELVDGRRLTELLERNGLTLSRLLDWAIPMADALAAAHRQGVVHRDLKPDNVMVTSEGRVKVLDFGLAKLRESALEGAGTLPTGSITEEGKILGTVSYMSPEQAEAKPLDHRSDIFSFGVVLYEMATGRKPFQGDTAISTISSILKDTPPLPHEVNTALPAQLGRIVRRCLAKEPERRYQSTDDLRNELRELKEESESGELTRERAATPGAAAPSRGAVSRGIRPAFAGAAIGVVVLAGAAWLWSRRGPATGPPPEQRSAIQMSRATLDGKVQESAISPDGRYIGYVRRDGPRFSLRLRQLASGNEVEVVAPGEEFLTWPAFSGDGDYLYYVSIRPGHNNGTAWRVSVLGGSARRVAEEVNALQQSPDGSQLAMMGGFLGDVWLRVGGPDGEEPRVLATRKGQDHFDTAPVWSSDGRSLAVVSHRLGEPQQIVIVDPATGKEHPLPVPSLRAYNSITWAPGTSSLLVSGSERPVNQRGLLQIREVSEGGETRPITQDLNNYYSVSVTRDGSTISAVQIERRGGVDIAPVSDGTVGQFTELLPVSASSAGLGGITWLSPDRLAHTMMQGEVQQIFVTDIGSKSTRALTSGPSHRDPDASHDGKVLAMVRDEGDQSHVWRMDVETGRLQRLSDGAFDAYPIALSDGSWILFSSARESFQLMKVAGTGGPSIEITRQTTYCVDVTPDDRDALCIMFDAAGATKPVMIPVGGGEPRPIPDTHEAARYARMGPDGHTITYLMSHDDADEIWSMPPQGGERRLVRFPEGVEIDSYAWSPDGSRLAVVKVTASGDVVLLKRPKS